MISPGSLGVDEQFYFVFPLIVWLSYGKRVCLTAPTPPSWLLLITTLCAISFGACWALSAVDPASSAGKFAFYMMPSRFWQLSSGALLLDIEKIRAPQTFRRLVERKSVVFLLDATALLCFGYSLRFTEEPPNFPLPWSMPSVVGTLAYIAAGTAHFQKSASRTADPAQAAQEPSLWQRLWFDKGEVRLRRIASDCF